MKESFSTAFQKLKNFIYPTESLDDSITDDFYRGSRAVQRRQKNLALRRRAGALGTVIVVLLVIWGIFAGIGKLSSASSASSLDNQINQLYTDNSHSDLKASVTQKKLSDIKSKIIKVKNDEKSAKLTAKETNAQNAFNVVKTYKGFYNQQKLVKANVTSKQVTNLTNTVNKQKLPVNFKDTYQKRLKNVANIVKTTGKLSSRYNTIVNNHTAGVTVTTDEIKSLIKDLDKNSKSQKSVDQKKKLQDLLKKVKKENEASAAAASSAATAASSVDTTTDYSAYSTSSYDPNYTAGQYSSNAGTYYNNGTGTANTTTGATTNTAAVPYNATIQAPTNQNKKVDQ